jgi:tripartite-type tricarboxylate transporter receptor subunit TctC
MIYRAGSTRRSFCCLLGSCFWAALSPTAHAEPYPSRPIKVIVPYPAGGGTDIAARWVADKLSTRLKQPVYVDNISGANGNLGTEVLAKSSPDGYVLGMAVPGPIASGRALYPNLPYDPQTAFAPIILVNESPIVLVVNSSLSIKSLKDLVAQAKAKSGKFSAALVSAGSIPHLLTEMLKDSAGIDLLEVPYRGGAPAILDVISGQVDMLFSVVPLVLPNIQAGQLRPIVIASKQRTSLLPKVPTVVEDGYPSVIGSAWNGIAAPAGTPVSIINKLNQEISVILRAPGTAERFAQLGMEVGSGSADDFARFLRSETDKWSKVIAAAHLTVQ